MPLYELGLLSTANKQRHMEPQSDDQEARALDQLLREACRAGCDLSGVQRAIEGLGAVVSGHDASSPIAYQEQKTFSRASQLKNFFSQLPPEVRAYFVSMGIGEAGTIASIVTDEARYAVIGWIPLVSVTYITYIMALSSRDDNTTTIFK